MPDTNKIATKLAAVSKAVGFLEFDAKNDHFKYGYASAAAVLRKLNTEFSNADVSVTTEVIRCDHELIRMDDGKPKGWMCLVHLRVRYTDCESGQVLTTDGIGCGTDKGDKAPMKAETAAIKYAHAHALVLGWGAEDPEGDPNTDKAAGARRSPSKARKGSTGGRTAASSKIALESLLEAVAAVSAEGLPALADEIRNRKEELMPKAYTEIVDTYRERKAALLNKD